MSERPDDMTRVTARRLKGRADLARLDAMTDDAIAEAVTGDPDAVPIDVDWAKAQLVVPPGKEVVTMRLDRDMLHWFRQQGRGHQTRMNDVLRAYMKAQRP